MVGGGRLRFGGALHMKAWTDDMLRNIIAQDKRGRADNAVKLTSVQKFILTLWPDSMSEKQYFRLETPTPLGVISFRYFACDRVYLRQRLPKWTSVMQ